MSRAFVKEDTERADDAEALPERPAQPLPITRAGRDALERELAELTADGQGKTRRARVLQQVLATTIVTDASAPDGRVGFGCSVDVEGEDGATRTFTIVGPDEIDPARGRVSVQSPLARALLGARVGDVRAWRKPGRDEELTIKAVRA